jgi:hypothetical protein
MSSFYFISAPVSADNIAKRSLLITPTCGIQITQRRNFPRKYTTTVKFGHGLYVSPVRRYPKKRPEDKTFPGPSLGEGTSAAQYKVSPAKVERRPNSIYVNRISRGA